MAEANLFTSLRRLMTIRESWLPAIWRRIGEPKGLLFSTLNLRGYRGKRPSWIADRSCCMMFAAELVRLINNEAPIFAAISDVVEVEREVSDLGFELKTGAPGSQLLSICCKEATRRLGLQASGSEFYGNDKNCNEVMSRRRGQAIELANRIRLAIDGRVPR